MTKGDKAVEQLMIDFWVAPLSPETPTLQDWATVYRAPSLAQRDPVFSMTPIENITVNGVPAVRFMHKHPMGPQGNIVIGIVNEDRIYKFGAYPATSKYLSALDQIIASIRFE